MIFPYLRALNQTIPLREKIFMVLVDPNNTLIMMAKHFHWLPHKEQECRIARVKKLPLLG